MRALLDGDLFEISRRDRNRDFIKNSEFETRDLKFETEIRDFKFVHFAEIKKIWSSLLT